MDSYWVAKLWEQGSSYWVARLWEQGSSHFSTFSCAPYSSLQINLDKNEFISMGRVDDVGNWLKN